MKTINTLLLTLILSASLVAPGSAKSIWDQINESAPLHPIFETLRDSAP